ncbi:MAG TPA: alpha/beta hydrolase [Gemmataceae bacterium]|nr:alpha/beta hydrolase [Gemmataceae bacterium]
MSRRLSLAFVTLVAGVLISLTPGPVVAAEPSFTRQADVIYGRKFGTALTMDIFTPKSDANGAAIILVVSGGFLSSHEAINPAFAKPFLTHGYTVFAVVHGSQPRFQIPEIIQDMNRSVRFIRHNAKDYGIDPNRLGITGGSAGGHLSLMVGMAGTQGDPNAQDPVDHESSRVQAVACFFPPTDFLNYGSAGREMIHATDHRSPFRPSFDYHELNKSTNLWDRITDDSKLRQIAHDVSPIYYISPDDPPTLITHGDKDGLVPLQQSESFIAKLKETGVEGKLLVKKGKGHGWPELIKDVGPFLEWFDGHLKKPTASAESKP